MPGLLLDRGACWDCERSLRTLRSRNGGAAAILWPAGQWSWRSRRCCCQIVAVPCGWRGRARRANANLPDKLAHQRQYACSALQIFVMLTSRVGAPTVAAPRATEPVRPLFAAALPASAGLGLPSLGHSRSAPTAVAAPTMIQESEWIGDIEPASYADKVLAGADVTVVSDDSESDLDVSALTADADGDTRMAAAGPRGPVSEDVQRAHLNALMRAKAERRKQRKAKKGTKDAKRRRKDRKKRKKKRHDTDSDVSAGSGSDSEAGDGDDAGDDAAASGSGAGSGAAGASADAPGAASESDKRKILAIERKLVFDDTRRSNAAWTG